jgi:hypothetical protein
MGGSRGEGIIRCYMLRKFMKKRGNKDFTYTIL